MEWKNFWITENIISDNFAQQIASTLKSYDYEYIGLLALH
jgi:hypothetical protein